jgi:hypothetical protein
VHESARLATSRSKGGMAGHVGALPNKTHSSYRTSLVALDDDFPDSPLGKLIVGASLSSRPFRPRLLEVLSVRLAQPFDRGDSSVEMEALSRVKCLQLRTKR